MEKRRKINKLKVGICIFIAILMITIAVFGRYIYNDMREAYFTSKKFYFTSNLLTLDNQKYTYEDWGGIDTYQINFDLYSYASKFLKLDYDLNYEVSCQPVSTDKIKCAVNTTDGASSATGTIYHTEQDSYAANVSKIKVYVIPTKTINKGENIKISIKAKTQEPYKKEISCEISLKIKEPTTNTYEIEDVANRNYLNLKLVNKSNRAVQYTLTFDPNEIRLDLNDDAYVNKVDYETTDINGNSYVNKVVFDVEKEATKNVKFYKVDMSKDYTYPNGDTSPIIDVAM